MRTLINLLCALAAVSSAFAATPVPKVSAPIPVTARSFPFLAADHNLAPTNLGKSGYVEEEFVVSGAANIYDWAADGSIRVKASAAPFATRILVRRPVNAARFSGNVVVELLNSVRRFDWSWMWGYTQNRITENGDAWVGITLPGGATGLKTFNAERYAAVSYANVANPPCAGPTEEGLRWDVISQVGALLKSNTAAGPLAGMPVQALYLTAGQSPDLMTMINAIHSSAVLDNGKPIFDAYLVKQPNNPARINQCAMAPGANDPRRLIANINVPVVAVFAQGEVLDGQPFRKADSDAPNSRFRLYEIAGAAHIDSAAYAGLPSLQEQAATGVMPQGTVDWPITARCDPDIPLASSPVMTYTFDAVLASLEEWVRKGIAPPKATRIELKDGAVALDEFGNGLGGVRNPYVDVPNGTYTTTSPGPGTCRELGHKIPFDAARMQTLYGTSYASKLMQAVIRLVQEKWLTEPDSRRIDARN